MLKYKTNTTTFKINCNNFVRVFFLIIHCLLRKDNVNAKNVKKLLFLKITTFLSYINILGEFLRHMIVVFAENSPITVFSVNCFLWIFCRQIVELTNVGKCVVCIINVLLTVTPGNGVTSEPVAIKIFFVFIVSTPFSPWTWTLFGATIDPTPRTSCTFNLIYL